MTSWQIVQEKKSARMIGNRQMNPKSSYGGHSGKELLRRPRSKIERATPVYLFASHNVADKNLCRVAVEPFSVAKLVNPTY
jgi:hypothetical protein